MKILKFTLILFLTARAVFAQDIIYTIKGEVENHTTSIDSILIENLSNHTGLLFRNLPVRDEYRINLSYGELWGPVASKALNQVSAFSVLGNMPGLVRIKYNKTIPADVRLRVVNINGQIIYTATKKRLYPQNSLNIKLSGTGLYFITLETENEIQTFKGVGSSGATDFDMLVTAESSGETTLKSLEPGNSYFSYNPGDSIRISAFKKNFYSRPQGAKIYDSDNFNFNFGISSVKSSGVSDAYVALNEQSMEVDSFDNISGELQIDFNEDVELLPGNIISVDVDSMYVLRKIISSREVDGKVILETEQAYLNDVFVNKEFKLHTGLINPSTQLKSTSSSEEISKALTDQNGYIHPFRVTWKDDNGKRQTKSALSGMAPQDTFNLIDYNKNLGKSFYGAEEENIHFYSKEESELNIKCDFICEFKFDPGLGEITEDTKVRKGDIDAYRFWLEGSADLKVLLGLDMNWAMEEKSNDPILLLPLGEPRVDFLIGAVPVTITFENDIFYNYEFTANAELHADWGFEYNHVLKIGAEYNRNTGDFSPIKESTGKKIFHPLEVEGEVEAHAFAEVYPRVEAKLYDFFGPYFELAPFITGDFNLKGQFSTEHSDDFVAWDNKFDIGLDFRVGSKLEFLWGIFDKEWGPNTYTWLYETIWEMPHHIQLISEIPKDIKSGSTIPLKFKVENYSYFTDLNNLPVPACPVYLEGDGTFNKKIMLTDINGEATVDWTVSETEGRNSIKAIIYNANRTVKAETSLYQVEVLSDFSGNSGFFTDTRDQNRYKWVKIGQQIWMAQNLAYLPEVTPQTIPDVSASSSWTYSQTYYTPCYYVYGYNGINQDLAKTYDSYTTYGVLYNQPAAEISCPKGWHLPSDSEWEQLTTYINNQEGPYDFYEEQSGWEMIGNHLKSKSNWNRYDDYGFNGLGAGIRDLYDGHFYGQKSSGYWWSTTDEFSDCTWMRQVNGYNDVLIRRHLYKQYGLSVRCLKN